MRFSPEPWKARAEQDHALALSEGDFESPTLS
jgi:hypothetical protein